MIRTAAIFSALLMAGSAMAAAPTISGTPATTTFTGNSGNVNLPASIAANDLILIFWSNDDIDENPVIAGFTQLDSGNGPHAVLGKKATGSEGATVAATLDTPESVAAIAVKIPAAEWSQVLAEVEVAYASLNNDPPSLTPAGGAADYLFIASAGITAERTVSAWPTAHTGNRTEQATPFGGGGTAVAIATRAATAASSDNPAAYTWSSGTGDTATVAVPPAGGGGPSTSVPVLMHHYRGMRR